jgi:signal transduction histidine kinase
MLEQLLTDHEAALSERCAWQIDAGSSRGATSSASDDGASMFLRQLAAVFRGQAPPRAATPAVQAAPPASTYLTPIGCAAVEHARRLLSRGRAIEQVVGSFGNVRQAITSLASEQGASIPPGELCTLNRCLDNAIAETVADYAYRRRCALAERSVHVMNERMGFLAHDMRNHIQTATLALAAGRASRQVQPDGASGAVLDRSLRGMSALIDRALAEVRATGLAPPRREPMRLAVLVADLVAATSLETAARGCTLSVADIDAGIAIDVDREMMFNAVHNLLHNAFKFTRRGSDVSLSARVVSGRVRIDVADHCGGLATDDTESLFRAFAQGGEDRSGLGLGLAIARRTVEAHDGTLTVRDVPGRGCVFTVELPLATLAPGAE